MKKHINYTFNFFYKLVLAFTNSEQIVPKSIEKHKISATLNPKLRVYRAYSNVHLNS